MDEKQIAEEARELSKKLGEAVDLTRFISMTPEDVGCIIMTSIATVAAATIFMFYNKDEKYAEELAVLTKEIIKETTKNLQHQ
jgi:hypothetical protein